MDSLLLLLILLGIAFIFWKLFFKEEKTDVEQHYRVVKKKIAVRGHQRRKGKKRQSKKRSRSKHN
jgi:hypothetical protein